MKTGYTVLKNFIYMIFSNFVARILSLITVVYLANILGPSNFGKLNFAIAFLGYFSVFGDFGISILSSRDISQNRQEAVGIINSTLGFRIIFSLAAFFLLTILSFFISRDTLTKYLVILYGLTIFTSVTFFLPWVFQGLEEMKYLSYSLIIQAIVYVSGIFTFIRSDRELIIIPAVLLISQAAAVLTQFHLLRKLIPDFRFKPDLNNFKKNVSKSYPVMLNSMMLIVGQSTPLLIIGFLLDDRAAGFFASSHKISILIWEVICNYMGVIFPAMSKNFLENREKMNKIVNYSLKLAFVFLMPATIFIMVLSYSITDFIYGNKFIQSYWTLKILIFLPLFMFVDSLLSNAMIIAHRQKKSSQIKLLTTTFMIVSSSLSARPWGINGVAFFILLSTAINTVAQYMYCRDFLKLDVLNSILKPVFYSSLAGGIVFYVKGLSLPASFILAMSFYWFMIYYFRIFSEEELQLIKRNLKMVKSRFFDIKAAD